MDLMRALLVGAVIKLILLMVMLGVSTSARAEESKAQFVMSAAHCAVLKQHAIKAITAKTAGVEYVQYVRERTEDYTQLSGMDRVIYLDILPYSLELAYEYYINNFDPATPYEEVIERNCLERVGSSAQ